MALNVSDHLHASATEGMADSTGTLEAMQKTNVSTNDRHYVLVPWSSILQPIIIPYPTAFPYGNGMVLHFYQQQESSTTKTVHKVINKGLKTYV